MTNLVILLFVIICLYCLCGEFYVRGRRAERKQWLMREELRKRGIEI